ncbi:hypothetical protein [Paraferrimonas sp. SM1919]|uniref:hypothetical protein n=1 Tax=Paraferrimonas sp. SM1919 TaxID=2662263 RepID=UPI0013D0A36A|nr:hypothetical protein [Paraferrimonas sp. SM1919]
MANLYDDVARFDYDQSDWPRDFDIRLSKEQSKQLQEQENRMISSDNVYRLFA